MIKIGTKVRKTNGGVSYYVKKLFGTFAEIEKLDRSEIEAFSNMTEYIDLGKLEEVDEDITGGCSGYS